MDIHRLAVLALPLSASLLAACGEATPPAVGNSAGKAPPAAAARDHRANPFHTVALGTDLGRPMGLRDSADLVPDAPADATWGAGLRPGRSASGISP